MSAKATESRMRTPARKASLMSTRTFLGSATKINVIGFASRSNCRFLQESPKERARKESPKGGSGQHRAASSDTFGKEAVKARSPGRQTVHLLVRQTSPTKKRKKPRRRRC